MFCTPVWLYPALTVLATCQLVETYRHGSLLATLRAWVESRGRFWDELSGCGFCFSHWAAGLVILLLIGDTVCAQAHFELNPFIVTLWWLSTIRGANLLNDLTHRWSRSPARDGLQMLDVELPPFDSAPLSVKNDLPPASEAPRSSD